MSPWSLWCTVENMHNKDLALHLVVKGTRRTQGRGDYNYCECSLVYCVRPNMTLPFANCFNVNSKFDGNPAAWRCATQAKFVGTGSSSVQG